MIPLRAIGQAACGLAFLFAAQTTSAGAFGVDPVRATLSAKHPVSSLIVRNHGAEPTVIQLEVVAWSQEAGKDIYVPTKEILATPPIFTVRPGGMQVVRVGLRRPADPSRELTYRLFLQEVPPARSDVQGLQVVLRMGIPVFVNPPVAVAPTLQWQASRTADGALRLTLSNGGNAHIQVVNSRLVLAENEQTLARQDVAAYVLAGESRTWMIKPTSLPPAGAALRVSAQTDMGDVHAEIVVE